MFLIKLYFLKEDINLSNSEQFSITANKVATNIIARNVTLEDVKIASVYFSTKEIFVKKIIIHKYDKESEIPMFADLDLQAVNFDNSIEPIDIKLKYTLKESQSNMLSNHMPAYKRNNFLVSTTIKKTETLYDLFIEEFSCKNKFAILDYSTEIVNLNIEKFKNLYSVYDLDSFDIIGLKSLKFKYTDNGLIYIVLKYASFATGESVSDIIEIINESLDNFLYYDIESKNENLLNSYAQSIKDFLISPDSISISITPNTPIFISTIYDFIINGSWNFMDFMNKYNVSIQFNNK